MSKSVRGTAPQHVTLIRQLLAERTNAVTYGNTNRVAAVDKQLAELGYPTSGEPPQVSRTSPPAERTAPHERTEKAAERRVPGKSTG